MVTGQFRRSQRKFQVFFRLICWRSATTCKGLGKQEQFLTGHGKYINLKRFGNIDNPYCQAEERTARWSLGGQVGKTSSTWCNTVMCSRVEPSFWVFRSDRVWETETHDLYCCLITTQKLWLYLKKLSFCEIIWESINDTESQMVVVSSSSRIHCIITKYLII